MRTGTGEYVDEILLTKINNMIQSRIRGILWQFIFYEEGKMSKKWNKLKMLIPALPVEAA